LSVRVFRKVSKSRPRVSAPSESKGSGRYISNKMCQV
jgi:hypothetical protein